MHVNPMDGRCRTCGCDIRIIDADEDRLVIECTECGDTYDLEPDALNDGAMTYLPTFLASQVSKQADR